MNKKTQLCRRFQAGTCAFNSNCNFAHSYEELRKPAVCLRDFVSLEKEEAAEKSEPREKSHILILGTAHETPGPFTMEDCSSLEAKQSEVRGNDAICLVPGRIVTVGVETTNWGKPVALDPSSWKTRMCFKWQQNGFCPYGTKCHYAHGESEMRQYGPRSDSDEVKDPAVAQEAAKQGAFTYVGAPAGTSRLSNATTFGVRPRNGKGPNKISKIYGDWIDDLE